FILILLFAGVGVFGFPDTVRSVVISGNNRIPVSDIFPRLTVQSGETILTENVVSDMDSLYGMGFFKDSVSAETVIVSQSESGNLVDIIYSVDENPIVEKIYFVGLTAFSAEQLQASMSVRQGRVLNYVNLREDIQTLAAYYHERGYVLMSVKEILEPQDNHQLTYVLREGQIEDIFLKGLSVTKEFVVTREMTTKVGSAFNVKMIQEDMRSIYNSGFFENVIMYPPIAGLNPDKVSVVVNLQEKRFGSLQFGGGVGSATGFFGFLKLEFMNVLGEGYNLSVQGQWGEKQMTYQLKYVNPWFFPDHTSLAARLWNTDGQVDDGQGIKAFSTGGELTMGKVLSREIKGSTTVRMNNVIPQDASGNYQSSSSYQVRSLGGGLSYDTRDFYFNPSVGDYIAINANSSLKLLGASIEFLKYQIRWNKYFPLMENVALGLKGTFDDSLGTIFDAERYYIGGATTIRGYRDGRPIGIGGRRYLGSVEVRYNIST
ncbi:MAG: POTRA domain-containing protein, partial [Candidatus Margulisiibacteriota bacterium]